MRSFPIVKGWGLAFEATADVVSHDTSGRRLSAGYRTAGIKAGVTAYLQKPVDNVELLAVWRALADPERRRTPWPRTWGGYCRESTESRLVAGTVPNR